MFDACLVEPRLPMTIWRYRAGAAGPEPKDTSPHRYGLADPDPYYAYYNYTLYLGA